jgi:hypothetical protein
VAARERLHCQMDPFVPLQVVVPVERLRALVALERAVILLLLLTRVVPVNVLSTHLMWGV